MKLSFLNPSRSFDASNLDALNEMQSVVLQDPDLTRVFYDFLQDETANFEEPDRRRLQGLVVMMFRNYEKAYFMNEYDLLGEDEWGRFQRIVCLNHARARSAGIEVVLPFVLTDRFTDYLESSCATRNCVDARCAALLHQAPQRPPKGSVDQIDHRDVDQRNW